MAGEDSTVAVTDSTREQPSGEQEKDQARDQTGHGETERDEQPGSDARPSPPLPPRPLPPSHQEDSKRQPLSQPPAVGFAPLRASYLPDAEPVKFERPHYPAWHRGKLVLGTLSLIVSAVILGVGLALGLYNAPYYDSDYSYPVDMEFGTSAAAAALAVVVTTGEFLKMLLSSRRQGMHPGALVAFHLFVWLMALVSVIITGILLTDGGVQYYHPRADRVEMRMQSTTYEQVLLGFDCVLLLIHFILFVGSCVETNRLERARKTVIIRVPVPVGAPYPGSPYPVYGLPQAYVAAPGAEAGQRPLPPMSQVPPQSGQGGSVAPHQQAVLYGGYYAPAPTGSQQQTGPVPLHGYYAPTLVPGAMNSAQPPRREGSAGPGASGSRRSRVQSRSAAQDTTSQQASQHVSKPEEPGAEKCA